MNDDFSNLDFSGSDAGFLLDAFQEAIDPNGFQIEGYEIVRELDRGGMGIVYLGQQENPAREVALKVMLPQYAHEVGMRERFYIEVRAMASLDHPAILPIYEVSESDGFPFFSMKLAKGGSLADRLLDGPLPPREASKLIRELADGLQHAHQRGVLHRDLKPGNFLFGSDGKVYISDFGVAKLADTKNLNLTQSRAFVGTPNYLPPEVASGSSKATIAGDIYSLGAVMYECLAGRKLFNHHENFASQLRAIVDENIVPPRSMDGGVPKDLETICLKALSKNPAERYSSAEEFASDLALWEADMPIRARPLGLIENQWRRIKRHKLASALVLAFLLLAGTSTVVVVNERLKVRESFQLRLHESLLAQAKTERLLASPGFRSRVFSLLKQAWDISPSPRIETEAIATLAKSDLVARPAARGDIERLSSPEPAGALVFEDEGSPFWAGRDALYRSLRESSNGEAIVADFLPDGRGLLFCGGDPSIGLLQSQGDSVDYGFPSLSGTVRFLSISPQGHQAAFGGSDGLRVLDLVSREWTWTKERQVVRCEPHWTTNYRYLIAALGEKKLIQVLRADDGEQAFTLRTPGWPELFASDRESKYLAASCDDGSVSIFDLTTESLLARLPFDAVELQFNDVEKSLLVTTSDGRMLRWTIAEALGYHEWRHEVGESLSISGAELSPDGRWLLISHTQGIELFSVETRKLVGFYSTENQRIDATTSAWWIPGSQNEILLQVPGAWEIIQVEGGGALTFSHHSDAKLPGVSVRNILPNGDWLVDEQDEDGESILMTWPAGRSSDAVATDTSNDVSKLTASPQGWQAKVLTDGRIEISGERDLTLTPPRSLSFERILFTKNGSRLLGIARDNQIVEWDLTMLSSELRSRGLEFSESQ